MVEAAWFGTSVVGLLVIIAISRIDKNTKKTAENTAKMVGLLDRFMTLAHQQQKPPQR